jgi:hypothetical protein
MTLNAAYKYNKADVPRGGGFLLCGGYAKVESHRPFIFRINSLALQIGRRRLCLHWSSQANFSMNTPAKMTELYGVNTEKKLKPTLAYQARKEWKFCYEITCRVSQAPLSI